MYAGNHPPARSDGAAHRAGAGRDHAAQRPGGEPKPKIPRRQALYERWRARLERRPARGSRPPRPIGDFDLAVSLAIRFGWTPEQIGRLDPDYVDELLARLSAEDDLRAEQERRIHGLTGNA